MTTGFRLGPLVAAALLLSALSDGAAAEPGRLDPDAAAAALLSRSAVLLEVRAPFERRRRAFAIPPEDYFEVSFGDGQWAGDLSDAEKARFLRSVGALHLRGRQILVVCEEGIRSREAASHLRQNGYDAHDVEGGLWGVDGGAGLAQALRDSQTFGID